MKNNSSGNTNDLIFGLTEKRYQRKKWAFLRFYRLIINETGSNPYFENIERRCQKRFFFLDFFSVDASDRTFELMGGRSREKFVFHFEKRICQAIKFIYLNPLHAIFPSFVALCENGIYTGWKWDTRLPFPVSLILSHMRMYIAVLAFRGEEEMIFCIWLILYFLLCTLFWYYTSRLSYSWCWMFYNLSGFSRKILLTS